MNRDEHVLATSEDGEFRVLLMMDEDPQPPYDDGGSPIIEHGAYGRWQFRVRQVEEVTSYRVDPDLLRALGHAEQDPRINDSEEFFERYARIFHGATAFEWIDGGRGSHYSYVTLDPADWRERVGAPEGSTSADEWRAYLEGEVYGYVVERKVIEESVITSLTGVPIRTVRTEAWDFEDSCWGFYGYEYAKEAALEALENASSAPLSA